MEGTTTMKNTPPSPSPRYKYDMIILGASGFTGKYVVKEALKFVNNNNNNNTCFSSFAIAGRNVTKLTETLKWASYPNPIPIPNTTIPILIADTTNPSSLRRLCSQTKLILNCVGPFRLYGDPVVAACVQTGCDYLDICGEPEFMERTELNYHQKAMESGSLVISACGFDSIPAELGVMFNSRQWERPAVPNTVEAFLSLESDKKLVLNLGTFESAVLGVANVKELQKLRRSRPKRARPMIPGSPPRRPTIEHQKNIGLWAVKLPSADSIVVRRTLSILAENPHGLSGMNESAEWKKTRESFWSMHKPAHFGVKMGTKSVFGILRIIMMGVFLGILGSFSFGRWLLLKFPSVFTLGWFRKSGPTEKEVNSASFKMWFVGHGFSDSQQVQVKPNMEIVTRVMGPEVGYITTPIILLQCALTLLSQRENLPKGGVFPPGIVFGPTDLQQRLEANGISFDVISKRALSG
ncbi:hypothetical protein ACFE04_009938 [Oxalis oulophora]